MAAEGYPGAYPSGHPIRGLDDAAAVPGVQVFQAGTRVDNGKIVTAGGRVLAVTGTAATLPQAKLQAYTGVRAIRWLGGWCRKDIADKGISRERQLASQAEEVGGR